MALRANANREGNNTLISGQDRHIWQFMIKWKIEIHARGVSELRWTVAVIRKWWDIAWEHGIGVEHNMNVIKETKRTSSKTLSKLKDMVMPTVTNMDHILMQ